MCVLSSFLLSYLVSCSSFYIRFILFFFKQKTAYEMRISDWSSDVGSSDLLDAKTRELIALAVAVTTRCDGCITVHVDAALKQGASREEIAEALGVAVALNAGAALVYSARVMDAVAAHE